jgi:hypothetical protein
MRGDTRDQRSRVARFKKTVAQSVGSGGSGTGITWAPDRVGTDIVSLAADGQYFLPRRPGWYRFNGALQWATNATGRRDAYLQVNGASSNTFDSRPAASGANTGQMVEDTVWLEPGDNVRILGIQDSGGALDVGTLSFVTIEYKGA